MTENRFLYQKIYSAVLADIQQGALSPGQKLPSPEQLAKAHQVSLITVTKALNLLAKEGFIRRVQGQGSFVTGDGANGQGAVKKADGVPAIGIILEHVSTPFGLDMMYQLDLKAAERGFKTLIRFSFGDRQKETEEIEYLTGLGISGLIIMPCHGRHYNPALLRLYLEKFPIVMIDKNMQGIRLPSVRTDNAAATMTLVLKLSEQGCRDIVFLTSSDTNAVSVRERRRGFLNGIDSVGNTKAGILPLPLGMEGNSLLSHQPQTEVMEEIRSFLFDRSRLPDGILCGEYGILPALCRVLETSKLPRDAIRIATIDEDYLAPGGYQYMHMKQDEAAIAKKAVELLFDQCAAGPEDVLIPAIFCPAPVPKKNTADRKENTDEQNIIA